MRLLLALSTIVGLLVVWVALDRAGATSPLYFPGPGAVVDALVSLIEVGYNQATLWENIAATLSRLLVAFVLAIATAIPLAVAMARSRGLNALVSPFIEFYRPLPPLAYLPLIIAWLGIGFESKVALLYLLGVPIILVPTIEALRTTRQDRVFGAQSLGASPRQLLLFVLIPSALPEIMGSIRLAYIWMFTALVAAELVGATRGIGWMIWNAAGAFQTPVVFVGVAILSVLGVVGERLIRVLQQRMTPWVGLA
jgi:taurine transport system permease protein